ncbi:DUF732 domain-containing protein [Mycolicibacterium sp. 050158]|uniref:DUF732 domain-containing protein n=1 Tax=Mycolicibacterium sp. 050158 TaxID=3090602 RepID=UPI00299D3F59|nr:DUF732 domain-containing protein [Mycolicibacterium sp. 050158]MDX1892825.1 DUF732 domain-containing protein [Mycolicibacterium sp. 050158]
MTAMLICSAASVALSIAGMAPARADASDQQYLEILKANDVSCGQTALDCPQGDESMIATAHAICRQLHGGNSARSVGTAIVRSAPGVQPDQAAKLVGAAETAYCPR